MSNALREVVELTEVNGATKKGLLIHIADTVRDGEHLFWRSIGNVAKRLGMAKKTVRNNLKKLLSDGLVSHVGHRRIDAGYVNEYRIEVAALLSLPCNEFPDNRAQILARSARGSKPGGQGMKIPTPGTESPPNHNYPKGTQNLAEKTSGVSDVLDEAGYTNVGNPNAHLQGDEEFCKFLRDLEAKGGART